MSLSAYVICATQRSGSTLLCDLLTESGVAGHPHSYFRPEDIAGWAESWGVAGSSDRTDPEFDRAYLAAMLRAGTAATGVFGLRLMWDSVAEAGRRLDAVFGGHADIISRLEQAFGPTLFIHLSRRDKVAQAVSLVRARQTGLWHIDADGAERERTAPAQTPVFDKDLIARSRDVLTADDRNWTAVFAQRGVEPFRLDYGKLAAAPQSALADILSALGRDPRHASRIGVRTARLAGADSATWVERMRSEEPGSGG